MPPDVFIVYRIAPRNDKNYAPAMALATYTSTTDKTSPATKVPVTVSSGFIGFPPLCAISRE